MVVLLVGFTALAVSRMPDGGGAVAPTLSPSPTLAATVGPSPSALATIVPTATPAPTAEPTVAATLSPEPTQAASPATYIVQSGDTLSAIAARFGTTVTILKELNGIEDPSRIRVGLVLTLP